MASYQEREYNDIQGAIPCIYRGELELNVKFNPESACCKDKGVVDGSKFFCSLYNKYITNTNSCWTCRERK